MTADDRARSATHATFRIERSYRQPPARVFAAWSRAEAKRQWFHGPPEWGPGVFDSDFRVGGRELSEAGPPGGAVHRFDATYHDIVPDRRIVFSYDLRLDAALISVSIATAEFRPAGAGTLLVYTEQGAFLDGYDDAGAREHGTRGLFEALAAALDANDQE